MPAGLSAASKTELEKKEPRLRVTAEIIKNYYATQTVIDITDRVISYGTYNNPSTLKEINWELPNMTIVVSNDEDYFHDLNSESIWATSPAKDIEACVLRIRLYVDSDDASEIAREYIGRILNCELEASTEFTTAQIVTIFEPGNILTNLRRIIDGEWTLYTSPPDTQVQYQFGGITWGAPWISIWPNWNNDATEPFPRWITGIDNASGIMKVLHENIAQTEIRYPQTKHSSSQMFEPLTQTHKQPDSWPAANIHRMRFHNPVSYFDKDPAEIVSDFLRYVCGINTSFIDLGSFMATSTYLQGLTSPPLLRAALYDKTNAELIADIMSYAPQIMMFWTHDSQLKIQKIPAYSGTASPYTFSTRSPQGISEITAIGKYRSRLATKMEVNFSSFTEPYVWQKVRDRQIGGLQDSTGGADLNPWVLEKTGPGTYDVEKFKKVDKPWFSSNTANYAAMVGSYIDNYLALYDGLIPSIELSGDLSSLENVNGDVVAVNIPERHLINKKYLVVGEAFDFDRMIPMFTLYDMEFV